MNSLNHASGDITMDQVESPKYTDDVKSNDSDETLDQHSEDTNLNFTGLTPQTIDDKEAKLKDRIAQCRNIIESLKMELNEEKSKLEIQHKTTKPPPSVINVKSTTNQYVSSSNSFLDDITFTTRLYSDSVDNKLNYDENLIEYEKQLQKYQNTLNMAQMEKKNAIRKQMLAKAYKLKLLEVENQCNIELLRVQQSLQCLEPLQMIASKWKYSSNVDDGNSYELIPRYPELVANSGSDINDCVNTLDFKGSQDNEVVKDESCLSPD